MSNDRQAMIDAINECLETVISNIHQRNVAQARIKDVFKRFQSAQSEPTYEQIQEYCHKRCLSIVDNALLNKYAQAEPHWIPCSERLPEEDGQYLITVKYVHVDDYEDIYSEHGEWADGKWDMFTFGHCGKVENIIAWMPLPEPYREEGEK